MSESELLLRLVEVVLLASLIELLWLLTHISAAPRGLLPNLLAGLSLALALRLGLGGAGTAWVAACLVAAGVCHVFDLRARWHRPVASLSPDASRLERFLP
ncbi:MAG: hypothetical protein EKK53_05035 [Burkholderiales bacterium]|nr:MAG: hypothetical protein EKK53_05035 [Burkholderiales bacterium]